MCHSPLSIPGRTKFSRLDNSAGCCFSTFRGNKILGYFEKGRKKNSLTRSFKWHQLQRACRLPRNIVRQPLLSRTAVSSRKQEAMATLEKPRLPHHLHQRPPRRGNQSENCEVIIWLCQSRPSPKPPSPTPPPASAPQLSLPNAATR